MEKGLTQFMKNLYIYIEIENSFRYMTDRERGRLQPPVCVCYLMQMKRAAARGLRCYKAQQS